jgi:RimJ/RimL family protein N-acetyltransferase
VSAGVRIRPFLRAAEPADAERVAEVLIESREALMPFAPSVHTKAQLRKWVRDVLLPGTKTTVAVVSNIVIGVIAVSEKEGQGWVEQLYIHPTHIGQGIGSKLLASAVATMPGPVRLYTFQQNARSRKFYERHGFVAVEFSDGSTNEERCPDVLYELAVPPRAV